MKKPWIKVGLGTLLLLPGLVLWLGPLIVEYGLLTLLPIVVAALVVGGVVLIADGSYDLTARRDRARYEGERARGSQ